MADTSIPRNADGLTYDEWLDQQKETEKEVVPSTDNLDTDDLIIGMDIARNISGIKASDLGLIVGHVEKPITPAITDNIQQPLNKYGATYQGMAYGVRTFSIPVTLFADDEDEYNRKLHAIADIIITPGTIEETSIVFGDEPNVMYYGHFSEAPQFTFLSPGEWTTSATLTFTATDPRGFMNVSGTYAPNHVLTVDSNPFVFTPLGTGMANPIVHIKPKSKSTPLTRFGYTLGNSQKDGVYVGMSTTTAQMMDTRPVVFKDDMTTMGSWFAVKPGSYPNYNSTLPFELGRSGRLTDGAVKVSSDTGTSLTNRIFSNTAAHAKASFATGEKNFQTVNAWHGPVIMSDKVTASATNNWELTVHMHHVRHYDRAYQGIEFYVLDDSGQRRLRFGIRDAMNGDYPFAYIRFGKNYNDEARAATGGLGLPKTLGSTRAKKNGKNSTIKLTETTKKTTYVSDKVVTTKTVETYGYYTRKIFENTTTTTSVYDTDTKKVSKTTVVSPIIQRYTNPYNTRNFVDYRTLHYKGTNNDSNGNPHLGDEHWFNPGDQKRQWDAHDGTLLYETKSKTVNKRTVKYQVPQKYSTRLRQKALVVNRTTIKRVETNTSKKGKTVTTTTTYTYVNGSNPLGPNKDLKNTKPGVLIDIVTEKKTVVSNNNQKTSTTYKDKTVEVKDLNNDDVFSDSLISFVIGHDDKGFYWQLWDLDDNGKSSSSKPMVSGRDKNVKAHNAWNFIPKQFAIHFAKAVIKEDLINGNTKKPAKDYTDDFLSVSYVKLAKVLQPLSTADLITLKSGEEAIIDSNTEVLTIDGKSRNDLLDIRSDFPQIQGGVPNKFNFALDLAQNDVVLEYRPTMK